MSWGDIFFMSIAGLIASLVVLDLLFGQGPTSGHQAWHCRAANPTGSSPILPLKGGETRMAKDPVCGMNVDEKSAAGKSEYKGQAYYFCSTGCKKSFDKAPEKYVGKQDAQPSGHP
jgi:Cu+-exporting ATPase